MDSLSPLPTVFRFDDFEMDVNSGELRRAGRSVSLPPQPLKVLALLVRRAGEVVSREEIRKEIWGDTSVDFERGLNFAINRIRTALGDDADRARFVETLPRRGYRFVAPVVSVPQGLAGNAVVEPVPAPPSQKVPGVRWIAGGVLMVAGLAAMALALRPSARFHAVAVLPFENLSQSAEDDYLAEGTTEALITELGRMSSLPVTSKVSSARYRKANKPLKEIAQELRVDAVLEGGVLRSADRVRVSVRLNDASTDRQIWSASYEKPLADVLMLQRDIAAAVAGAIDGKLGSDGGRGLRRPGAVDPETYQLYVRGRFLWNKGTAESTRQAIADFQQALKRDPQFALAHAGLADAYAGLPVFFGTPAAEAYPQAKQAAERALAIDPNLAEAVNVLAEVAEYSWNWAEAEQLFQRVFQLNPSYAQAYHDYGFYLIAMGRVPDAIAWTRKACMLDPLSVYYAADLAMNPFLMRDYDESIRQLKRVLPMDPGYATTYLYLAYAQAAKGELEEALAAAQKSVSLDPENPFSLSMVAYVKGKAGRREEARRDLDMLAGMARRRPISSYHFGFGQLGLGDNERAIEYLLKAYEERMYMLPIMTAMPQFDPIRSDPRMIALFRRMGVPY